MKVLSRLACWQWVIAICYLTFWILNRNGLPRSSGFIRRCVQFLIKLQVRVTVQIITVHTNHNSAYKSQQQCIQILTNHSNTIPFHVKRLCSIQLPVGQRKPPEVMLRDKKMSKLQELREREIAFKESYSIFDEMFMCFRCLFDWTQQCEAVLRNHISCSPDHLEEQIKVAVCEVNDKWFISCLLKVWSSCKYVRRKFWKVK